MSNEIRAYQSGATNLYSVIRNAAGQVWYPTGEVFEAWGTAARTADDYAIALVDKSGGMFVGDFDVNVPAGDCILVTHQQEGVDPEDTDPAIYKEDGYWDETTWSTRKLETIETTIETIAGDVAGLDGAAMVGTNGAALASAYTATRAGYLDELAAANIPTDVDTLKTYCDKIDDSTDGLTAIKAEVEGLAGAAMRGTNGAITSLDPITTDKDSYKATGFNTVIPDAAGIAAGLHTTTNNLIGVVGGIVTTIAVDVAGLDGAAMRGTNNANTVVPDVAGTAAALHAITDGKIDAVRTDVTIIAADVAGLDGAAMRGTNGANTVVPDVAGTAAALHATTNGKIDTLSGSVTSLHTVTDGKIDGLNDLSAAEVVTALMADTGFTQGGTMTFQTLQNILAAWIAGKWRSKAGNASIKELLDPDDDDTVILEMTLSTTTPYRSITVKI